MRLQKAFFDNDLRTNTYQKVLNDSHFGPISRDFGFFPTPKPGFRQFLGLMLPSCIRYDSLTRVSPRII
jgi:hypothetical protein